MNKTEGNCNYNLNEHGDYYERKYANSFLKNELPDYEKFWQQFVVDLT